MAQVPVIIDNLDATTDVRAKWADEITRALKRYEPFWKQGDEVQDRYLLEKDNNNNALWKDRYNILYSSTETTKPSLYAQAPRVQAVKRHKDRENDKVTYATMLLEACGQYALEEVNIDAVMKSVVQDFLLPGLGQAWVRYEPTFGSQYDDKKEVIPDTEVLTAEGMALDYVFYKDFVTGFSRTWLETPWCARRVYFSKTKAVKRFGAEKAQKLSYSYSPTERDPNSRSNVSQPGTQAIMWEIWDKDTSKVYWYSEDYSEDVLDEIVDPLKLPEFFPCPEPLRAVWTTRRFIPKSFFSQYKAQQDELDNITERIRYLTQALRVVGVYDGSNEVLQQILSGVGNKMVAVQNWAAFAQGGGMTGAVQWVPIREVAEVLNQLFAQREIVKNEIYEITGFSDIVRGVSKASETLGAQKIKADWAGGRLRDMQKDVQRFCRDIIRIMTDIISEQFSEASLALYSGFEPPEVTPEEQAAAATYAIAIAQPQQVIPGMPMPQKPQKPPPTMRKQALDMFSEVVALIRSEKRRCALIGIETDSTIQSDEASEREDRMQFLSSAGAFLQQAGPMALQFPEMRGLLGGIMMFAIRTFRASRPLEKEFEDFTKKLASAPPTPPKGEGGTNLEDAKIAAQADMAKQQAKAQSDMSIAQLADATKRYEVDQKTALERMKLQQDHEYRMAQLQLDKMELALEEKQQALDAMQAVHDAELAVANQQHQHKQDEQFDRQDEQFDRQQERADADWEAAKASEPVRGAD